MLPISHSLPHAYSYVRPTKQDTNAGYDNECRTNMPLNQLDFEYFLNQYCTDVVYLYIYILFAKPRTCVCILPEHAAVHV